MSKLHDKVAIVSGSGRGIGRAIAIKLAGEGAKVVLNDLDADPVAETAELIRKAGGKAEICMGDVTAPDFGTRFVSTAVESFGGLDIIVNNAGYAWDSVIQKMTDQQWYAMIDVHATAPFRILRAASEFIRANAKAEKAEGRVVTRKVVNVSSIGGICGNAGQMGYAAGKTALIGMTKTLAKEWGRYNVTVNCVAFGMIQTRITKPIGSGEEIANIGGREIRMGLQPEMIDASIKAIPLGRAGTPEDAAGAVYMFCIPESDYVSGEILLAAGGFVM